MLAEVWYEGRRVATLDFPEVRPLHMEVEFVYMVGDAFTSIVVPVRLGWELTQDNQVVFPDAVKLLQVSFSAQGSGWKGYALETISVDVAARTPVFFRVMGQLVEMVARELRTTVRSYIEESGFSDTHVVDRTVSEDAHQWSPDGGDDEIASWSEVLGRDLKADFEACKDS